MPWTNQEGQKEFKTSNMGIGQTDLLYMTRILQVISLSPVHKHCRSFSHPPPVFSLPKERISQMSILLAAVLGELTTRSINFLVQNSFKATTPDVEDRLRRILLRAQVIIDEAMGRQITNRGVLEQLDKLRDSMHHGYYILDTFIYQSQSEKETKGQVLSNTLSLSNVVNSLQGHTDFGTAAKVA